MPALVTDQASLEAEVADWLNRTDLTTPIKTFIQIAEAKFRKDSRIRNLTAAAFSITGDDLAVPSTMKTLESLYHDTDTIRGPIEIVGSDQLGSLKAAYGPTGIPRFAAITDAGTVFRFAPAPAPGQTFETKIVFWEKLTALSAGSNFLMTDHPDIYLYGALKESAMFLKDDQRLLQWAGLLEESIENLHRDIDERMFSGTMTRQFVPIGG